MSAPPSADHERPHVGPHRGHDGAEEEGDAVAVGILTGRQQQAGERPEQADPRETEDRGGDPLDGGPPFGTDEVPDHRGDHEQDQYEG